MPIKIIHENQQSDALQAYNAGKPKNEIIISVMRNAQTGWPMMRMSLFIPSGMRDGQTVYEPAFGGGNCHGFIFSAFGMAELLGKIPGKVEMTVGSKKTNDKPSWDNLVDLLHNGYTFQSCHLGITISSTKGLYGKELRITLPEELGDSANFSQKLWGYQDLFKLPFLGGWSSRDSENLTESDMISRIDPERGIIYQGQLYIDTGKFFAECTPEIRECFKSLFKVDEALALMKDNHLEPENHSAPAPSARAQKELTKEEMLVKDLNDLRNRLASNNNNDLNKVYIHSTDKLFGSSIGEYIHCIGRVIGIVGGMDIELSDADKKALHGGELHDLLAKYRDILPSKITDNLDGIRSKLKDMTKGISILGFTLKK